MDLVSARATTRPPSGRTQQENTSSPPQGGWAAWYLTDEDDVGESTEQGIIVRLLLAALAELARERGWARSLVAGDQFFAWVEAHPLVRVSPDVYVLDDPPPPPYPAMWQTWRPGHAPPRFAVEVVSDDWKKDYRDAPRKYDQLGARELVIFDPDAALPPAAAASPCRCTAATPTTCGPAPSSTASRRRLRRPGPPPRPRAGRLVQTSDEQNPGDATASAAIARDPAGRDLVRHHRGPATGPGPGNNRPAPSREQAATIRGPRSPGRHHRVRRPSPRKPRPARPRPSSATRPPPDRRLTAALEAARAAERRLRGFKRTGSARSSAS
jgi:hypothetical protein